MSETMLTVSSSEFGKLDILVEDGKELFPANECAKMLGYSNPKDAVGRHCRGVVKRDLIDALGRMQKTNFIPEGDVWRLIIRSRLPGAERFEKWLFDEVLPELRRNGQYRMEAAARAPEPEQAEALPHTWLGRPCIRVSEAAKRLGVKKEKVSELLRSRPTVYCYGEDWETLRGNELSEFKFFNRMGGAIKGMMVIYESGMKKLLWELHGIGSAKEAMGLPETGAQLMLLPEAVEKENIQMKRRMARIAEIAREK